MTLFCVAIGGVGLLEVWRLGAVAEDVATNWMPSVKALSGIRDSVGGLRRMELQALLLEPGEERATLLTRMATRHKEVVAQFERYLTLVSSQREQELAEGLRRKLDSYLEADLRVIEQARGSEQARREAVVSIMKGDSRKAYTALGENLDASVKLNEDGADEAAAAAATARRQAYIEGRQGFM